MKHCHVTKRAGEAEGTVWQAAPALLPAPRPAPPERLPQHVGMVQPLRLQRVHAVHGCQHREQLVHQLADAVFAEAGGQGFVVRL